jgi:hypothetical protein
MACGRTLCHFLESEETVTSTMAKIEVSTKSLQEATADARRERQRFAKWSFLFQAFAAETLALYKTEMQRLAPYFDDQTDDNPSTHSKMHFVVDNTVIKELSITGEHAIGSSIAVCANLQHARATASQG